MNAYELGDIGQSLYANALTTYAIFLTLVSGYLVVAYTIGAKLERAQLWAINILYLITCTNTIGVMAAYNAKAHYFSEEAVAQLGLPIYTEFFPSYAIALVDACVVFVSLYFMWNMRRSKRE